MASDASPSQVVINHLWGFIPEAVRAIAEDSLAQFDDNAYAAFQAARQKELRS